MTTDDAGSAPEADADPARFRAGPAEPAPPPSGRAVTRRRVRSARAGSARAAWRRWRRSRPFWGGLLLILAGLELLALPLTGVFVRGAIKLVIYIGIGGVFGVLIGVLLIASGIAAWVNPTHRVFYGIAGIVLGIVSFPASNLGGFLLGMLLAIIGGALAFAWTPAEPGSVDASPPGPAGGDAPVGRGGDTAGARTLAVAALPALLVAGLLGTGGTAAAPRSGGSCILGFICLPSPSGSPSPSASPTPTPTPSGPAPAPTPSATSSAAPSGAASPSATPSTGQSGSAAPSTAPSGASSSTPSAGASPSATGSPSPSATSSSADKSAKAKAKNVAQKYAAAPASVTAPAAASVLSAGSVTMTDFQYQGNVSMPVTGGAAEEMMEFTASSASLSGDVTVAVTQGGLTTDTSSPALGFSDGMTLYATKLCGNIFGLVPKCFTPTTANAVLLSIANLLTGAVPITMTDVTTDQPLATAGALQTGSLTIGF